nr:radical SAM protein [uncultured Holophaga sp.]
MAYLEPLFRPPAEADSLILQATLGCSWNTCSFCGMYRGRPFRIRPLEELLTEIAEAAVLADAIRHVFVADGDALVMPLSHWEPMLLGLRGAFPRLRRVSAYASARNVLEKTPEELRRLRELGLNLLYMGPESGDDVTLKLIAKGSTATEYAEAARRAREAGLELSVMFLLGIGGRERSREHALASARLATAMEPRYLSTLTLTVVPGTPITHRPGFTLPLVPELLMELQIFLEQTAPPNAIFRADHASNHLALSGRLPRDRERLLGELEAALSHGTRLRPQGRRGL